MGTLLHFDDTPQFESGLGVHEAECKWLTRELNAVLTESKTYARSLLPGAHPQGREGNTSLASSTFFFSRFVSIGFTLLARSSHGTHKKQRR